MLTYRVQASRFVGELLQEPSASRHGMPYRVVAPGSGNAVLYNWIYSIAASLRRGYLALTASRQYSSGLIYP